MGLRINTDIESLAAHMHLRLQNRDLSRSFERMSSGLAINHSSDDPGALGVSEKMRAQIRGLALAQRNAQDGVSLVQTADGYLEGVHSILQRIRELAVQFNNTVYDASQRAAITAEVAQLSAELGRLGLQSQFMGISLLSGATRVTFQVGANSDEIITLQNVSLVDPVTGLLTSAMFTWGVSADIALLDSAMSDIADARARYGAVQNRLEAAIDQLAAYEQNMQASESRVRDVDTAAEMTRLTRLQVARDANLAMLAQGNLTASSLLRLLEG